MAESIFLSADELAELTGRKRKAGQIEWLRENRVPHWISATGTPKVARDVLLGQRTKAPPPAARPAWSPAVLGA